MQISFVMLIFLLFSDQISGGGSKSLQGKGANCLRGVPPPVEESQNCISVVREPEKNFNFNASKCLLLTRRNKYFQFSLNFLSGSM